MVNRAYSDIIRARVAGALAEAAALRAINHDGLVGALRETVIRQLIVPLLPSHMGASTGIVTSCDGEQSRQCDIVIYDRRALPPVLVAEAGLFPIEAVVACVEVKSRLTKTELKKAHENALSLFHLPIMSGIDEHERPVFQKARTPLAAVFAFDTDLAKESVPDSEIFRYHRIYTAKSIAPMIELLCVVGSGCWIDTMQGWVRWSGDSHEEVLGFLACLCNTIPGVAATRGETRLGVYLRENGPREYVTISPAAQGSEPSRRPETNNATGSRQRRGVRGSGRRRRSSV